MDINRPKCIICGKPAQRGGRVYIKKTGEQKIYYNKKCSRCIWNDLSATQKREKRTQQKNIKKPYLRHKGRQCEFCGFIAIDQCQLDVDHIDGDHKNNNSTNLQTLCSNCHRLKTFLRRQNWPLAYRR